MHQTHTFFFWKYNTIFHENILNYIYIIYIVKLILLCFLKKKPYYNLKNSLNPILICRVQGVTAINFTRSDRAVVSKKDGGV